MKNSDVEFSLMDGTKVSLGGFIGKAVLIVNTASECGYTKQYEALQNLYRQWMGKGLVVIAVPSNDFGGQEPASNDEISKFCRQKFNVNFPIAQKTSVIGSDAHDFYKWVAMELGEDHLPKWNFHKYLLDKKGKLAASWPSRVSPDHDDVLASVKSILG